MAQHPDGFELCRPAQSRPVGLSLGQGSFTSSAGVQEGLPRCWCAQIAPAFSKHLGTHTLDGKSLVRLGGPGQNSDRPSPTIPFPAL